MKNKKIIILVIVIILAIATIVAITRNTKMKEERKTSFKNNVATSNVVLDDIEFKNITKTYEKGITTIRADVYNNTKQEKSINVKIILKDNTGKELTSMIQAIEEIASNGKKVLQTGIMGNYSNVDNIEFKVLSDKDLEQYNK